MEGWFDAEEVLAAAQGHWVSVLQRLQVDGALLRPRHGPCPGCGGRDRFRFDDRDGNGSFICSQGGGGNLAGNGIALLQHVHGWEWKRCIEEVGRIVLDDSRRRGWRGGKTTTADAPVADPVADEPTVERPLIPPYDPQKLKDYVSPLPEITRETLRRISPIPVGKATAAEFLDVLYDTDERVMIFTEFYNQGDFIYQVGKEGYRLSSTRGVRAVKSALPDRGRNGVWFLCNPVHGTWEITESKPQWERLPDDVCGPPSRIERPSKWGRRSWRSVTSWRYAVLESDDAVEELWLKALVKLPVPIVAIYSSGGKSVHALIRIDAGDKLTWDLWVRGRNANTYTRAAALVDLVCPLGADPAALTGVRLTRLPFCLREGTTTKSGYHRYEPARKQELLYLRYHPLDRKPEWVSIEQRHKGVLG